MSVNLRPNAVICVAIKPFEDVAPIDAGDVRNYTVCRNVSDLDYSTLQWHAMLVRNHPFEVPRRMLGKTFLLAHDTPENHRCKNRADALQRLSCGRHSIALSFAR
jgi:hypothetical protein